MNSVERILAEPSSFELEIVLESSNRQVLVKFRQNWYKQEVIHRVLRSTNSLILFGTKKNCHNGGKNLLYFLFMKGR